MNIITFDDKVALNENPNVPDINKVKDSDINQLKSALNTTIWNLIYPIGSIVIKADNADYSNWLGFTWEKTLVGRVAVGQDTTQTEFDTIGETGGSKYLQEHNHMGRTYSKNYNAGQTIPGGRAYARSYVPSDDTPGVWKYSGSGAVSGAEITSMIETGNAGTGNSGNLQPYQVVAYWKRTA